MMRNLVGKRGGNQGEVRGQAAEGAGGPGKGSAGMPEVEAARLRAAPCRGDGMPG